MAHVTRWFFALSFVAALACAGVAIAEVNSHGDPKHGKAIAAGPPELPAEQACSSCHGDTGEGNPDSGIPRLSAQSQEYLLRALDEYANGLRQNEVMTPIAKALKDKQKADVTAYYSSLRPAEWKQPKKADAKVLRHGEELARVGSPTLGVQGCSNCHGPQGRGLPPTAPYLAGQPTEYLASRLKDWQKVTPGDDPTPANIMAQLARHLKDDDVAAVSQYFAQLPPDPIRLGAASPEKSQ